MNTWSSNYLWFLNSYINHYKIEIKEEDLNVRSCKQQMESKGSEPGVRIDR